MIVVACSLPVRVERAEGFIAVLAGPTGLIPRDIGTRDHACGAASINGSRLLDVGHVVTRGATVFACHEVGEPCWVVIGGGQTVLGTSAVSVGKGRRFVVVDAYGTVANACHARGALKLRTRAAHTLIADAVVVTVAGAVFFAADAVGSAAIYIRLRAVEHPIIAAGHDTDTVLTAARATVGSHVARTAQFAASAGCSTAVDVGLASVGDAVGAAYFGADIRAAHQACTVAIAQTA